MRKVCFVRAPELTCERRQGLEAKGHRQDPPQHPFLVSTLPMAKNVLDSSSSDAFVFPFSPPTTNITVQRTPLYHRYFNMTTPLQIVKNRHFKHSESMQFFVSKSLTIDYLFRYQFSECNNWYRCSMLCESNKNSFQVFFASIFFPLAYMLKGECYISIIFESRGKGIF